jgi:hypothetical protein
MFMKIQTKKFLAREVLIFAIIILFSCSAFIVIYPYNYYLNSRQERIQDTINKKVKEISMLQKSYEFKLYSQKKFFLDMQENFNLSKRFTPNLLWDRIEYLVKNDSTEWQYNSGKDNDFRDYLEKLSIHNYKEYSDFINANILNKDDKMNIQRVNKLKQEIGYQSKFYPSLNKENLKFLYDYAKSGNLDVGTLGDFEKNMQDSLNRKDFYDFANRNKLEMGSYSDYNKGLVGYDKPMDAFKDAPDSLLNVRLLTKMPNSNGLTYLKQIEAIKKKEFSKSEQIEFGFNVLIVLFILAYPIRYFILLGLWSIRILKSN